jgi:uncharacterized protein YbbC (DUF1343 family)
MTLFSPEHGIRGTEDRENVASGVDERSSLAIHSLYGAATIALPDSTLRGPDALVVDLQDIGTRTWTYALYPVPLRHGIDDGREGPLLARPRARRSCAAAIRTR